MEIALADLWDAYPDELLVCEAQFRGFGRRRSFAGPCMTVKAHEDHRALMSLAATPGQGRVLVVDAGGSLRVASMGDRIAAAAAANGWVGAVIYGAIRDTAGIDELISASRRWARPPGAARFRSAGWWVFRSASPALRSNRATGSMPTAMRSRRRRASCGYRATEAADRTDGGKSLRDRAAEMP